MCTSLAFKTNDFYFGRNMDLDYHFGERVVVTPRNYPLTFKYEKTLNTHYAIIGMAAVQKSYPLYAEGANEAGLCISALNFPQNAIYNTAPSDNGLNLAPYEIIPYILASCASVDGAKNLLRNLSIVNTPFDENTDTSPLHWHIADRNSSITLESTSEGLKIYENPVGVLTNNPPFDAQLSELYKFSHIKPKPQKEGDYSMGMSFLGVAGDFSSTSRFVKASLLKKYALSDTDEISSVSTVLRLMYSVSPIKGCVLTKENKCHYTTYTCVINASKGIYYYTDKDILNVKSVCMHDCDLNADILITKNF